MKFAIEIQGLRITDTVAVETARVETECTSEEYLELVKQLVPALNSALEDIERQRRVLELLNS